MTITNEIMERFLQGQTSVEETVEIMAAIAINPELEEYVVTQRRMAYTNEQMADYGSFIPISSMAADDGQNLCDFQCETYILKAFGKKIEEDTLANESRQNYWLRGEGTPLYNMGKLLEREGLLVNRRFDATLDELEKALNKYKVIVVVNGDMLVGKEIDIFADDFNFENNPKKGMKMRPGIARYTLKDKDNLMLKNSAGDWMFFRLKEEDQRSTNTIPIYKNDDLRVIPLGDTETE